MGSDRRDRAAGDGRVTARPLVAVVTGAASPIGQAIARRSRRFSGAQLALGDLAADALADFATAIGGCETLTVAGDLSEMAVAAELIGQAKRRFGRVDVLVNNAGGGVIREFLEAHARDAARDGRPQPVDLHLVLPRGACRT